MRKVLITAGLVLAVGLAPAAPAIAAPAANAPAADAPRAANAPAATVATTPTAVPTVPGGVPYPEPAVCVDTAAALGPEVCPRIVTVLAADEKATTDQLAVAVVPSTGGASIETWGTGLYNAWGVGQAGKDNGVLLVVALRDRRVRLVTGDGMRSRLPDWQASEIVGGTITPLLREGRTAEAVYAGLDAVRRAIGHRVGVTNALLPAGTVLPSAAADPFADTSSDDAEESGSGGNPTILWVVLLVGIAVLAWVYQLAKGGSGDGTGDSDGDYRPRRPAYRSFSSSSRSSSSRSSSRSSSSSRRSGFGGGRSSGGGASGSW